MRAGMIGAAVACLALGAMAFGAKGASLGLTAGSPDIMSSQISGDYTGGILTLGTSGNLMSITPTHHFVFSGTYSLTANVNSAGNLNGSGNSFTISGTLLDSGMHPIAGGTGTALTGTLTQFGFDGSANHSTFEFLFSNASGYLRTLEGFGSTGGIIISADNSTFNGGFAGDFTVSDGTADTFTAVPLPMALPAGLVLLGGVFAWRTVRRPIGC